jgi:hypothetical protein
MTKKLIRAWNRAWKYVATAIEYHHEINTRSYSEVGWSVACMLSTTRDYRCRRDRRWLPANRRLLEIVRCNICGKDIRNYYRHEDNWDKHRKTHLKDIVKFCGGKKHYQELLRTKAKWAKARCATDAQGVTHSVPSAGYYRQEAFVCGVKTSPGVTPHVRRRQINCLGCIADEGGNND